MDDPPDILPVGLMQELSGRGKGWLCWVPADARTMLRCCTDTCQCPGRDCTSIGLFRTYSLFEQISVAPQNVIVPSEFDDDLGGSRLPLTCGSERNDHDVQ